MSRPGGVFKPVSMRYVGGDSTRRELVLPLKDCVIIKPLPLEGDENQMSMKGVVVQIPLEACFHPYPCPVCNGPEYDRQQAEAGREAAV